MSENFDHIINWKLKSKSHDFPGPDGGTCINEAAIVAAGFEYKAVRSADDCPPCFSRPIAAYAIVINDGMPDETRQALLMPFVTRLSDTADTPEVEQGRTEYIVIETVRRIVPLVIKDEAIAERCRQVKTLGEASDAARAAANAAARAAARAAAYAAAAARAADAADAADAAYAAAAADAAYAAYAAAAADAAAYAPAYAAARAAADPARAASWEQMADKLIALIEVAPDREAV